MSWGISHAEYRCPPHLTHHHFLQVRLWPSLYIDLPTVLLELPVSIIKRAYLSSFEPTRDAVEVEGMVTDAPCHCTFFTCSRRLVCLTLDAEIHDMISADSTVIHDDIPSPESYGVPLLDFEPLLAV